MRGYLGRYGSDIATLELEGPRVTIRSTIGASNPSYLAWSSDRSRLYAVLEADDGGGVAAYACDGDRLEPLGTQATGGRGACHLSVDLDGHYLLTANYRTGNVTVHPIEADGSLGPLHHLVQHDGSGPDTSRQQGPHAHMVVTDPARGDVLAVDLGTDSVYRYLLQNGRLKRAGTAAFPPGSGPRHLAFHPYGRYAYVVGELDSTVSVLDLDRFRLVATVSTVPSGTSVASYPSAIRTRGDGKFCYVANRGPNSIAVFAVESAGSVLRLVATVPCGGEHPRDLVIHKNLMYVANQDSDCVVSFRLDPGTGIPQPTGDVLETTTPACILVP